MKSFIPFLLLLLGCISSNTLSAQNALSTAVKKQFAVKQAKSYRPFTVATSRNTDIDREIKDVVYLNLDTKVLDQLMQEKPGLVTLYIPAQDGREIPVQLLQYDFRSADFRTVVQSSGGKDITGKINGLFYRGAISGTQASMAACSFYEDELSAVFSDAENGNYNLVPNPSVTGAKDAYILFREKDILSDRGTLCGMTEDATKLSPKGITGTDSISDPYETLCNTVRVSVFADSILYGKAGGTIPKASKYLNSLFNVISALYANDNLFLSLSETFISTVSQGYDYSTSELVLRRFGNLVQTYTYNGDAAIFLTGTGVNLGGLAWLDVLCRKPAPFSGTYIGPYSMAKTYALLAIPKVPIYSWDVEVAAHELGHTIGSPHTQDCGWPGGPIDNCVSPEGGCSTVGPAPVKGGTIMSYCHLASGVGINFANGFGPLPRQLLKDQIIGSSCLRSGRPDSTLKSADSVIIANAECNDGVWSHYFFDNNTSDLNDDVLLLSIEKGSLDIGSISDSSFVVKMITNDYYGKDTAPDVSYPYATVKMWYEINRRWTIQFPDGKQPASEVRLRYPFLAQDVKDISKVLTPLTITAEDLVFVKYATDIPVKDITTATGADIRTINNSKTAASPSAWKLGTSGGYNYVEVIADSGVYGGTLGHAKKPFSISGTEYNQRMSIRPNPATQHIFIEVPTNTTGAQQVLIYDQVGKLALRTETTQSDIDISSLSPGVYTLKWISKDQAISATGIFVKQ